MNLVTTQHICTHDRVKALLKDKEARGDREYSAARITMPNYNSCPHLQGLLLSEPHPGVWLVWVMAGEIKCVSEVEDKSQFSSIGIPCFVKSPKLESPSG